MKQFHILDLQSNVDVAYVRTCFGILHIELKLVAHSCIALFLINDTHSYIYIDIKQIHQCFAKLLQIIYTYRVAKTLYSLYMTSEGYTSHLNDESVTTRQST